VATQEEALRRWRHWAEQELGGPNERIEASMDAATFALANGKSQEEIAATARPVAAASDEITPVTQNEVREPSTEEKNEFTVVPKKVGTNKLDVIMAIRDVTGLGLEEAKDLADRRKSRSSRCEIYFPFTHTKIPTSPTARDGRAKSWPRGALHTVARMWWTLPCGQLQI
jgi:large subunit ribosomal protein L7/L12